MTNFGPVPIGSVLPVFFASYAGSTGASITLTGLAVTDIEIYKGTSMTQRASDAGYALLDTDGIDVDGTTGIHAFSIDTGDNTDSGFFAAGSFYTVIVSAVTVDSQTVNFIAATFRLVPAESSSGVPKVDVSHFGGTAGTFSGGRPEVNTTHAAGTAWGSGAITAASIASDAITAAKIADGAIDAATFAAGAINAAAIAADAITDAKVASDVTIASVTGAVGSVTGNVGGNVTGSVGSIATGGISAASFAAGAVDAAALASDAGTEIGTAVWASAARTLTALDEDSTTLDLDATIRAAVGLASANLDTQLTAIDDYLDTEVAAIKAKTDNLPASPAATGDIPTAAAVADAVWDEAIAGHAISGSTGEALAAAGAAGDPWITALPGSYSAGQAGYILGTNLNATVSSRATQTSVDTVDDFLDTEIAAIKAKTDNLPASPAATGDIPTATENADALLARDLGSGSNAGSLNERTVRSALRHIRNKWSFSGTTLTVTKEDDSTTAWTSTVSTNAAADPITGSDPA